MGDRDEEHGGCRWVSPGCHDCSRASFWLAFHLLGLRQFILTSYLKHGFIKKTLLPLNFGVRFPPASVAGSFLNLMPDEDLAMRLHTGAVWRSWNIDCPKLFKTSNNSDSVKFIFMFLGI